MPRTSILIEGMTPDELVALDELEELAVTGEPIAVRVGSADVLAQFSIEERTLRVELAVIENGGEGVLPTLISVIERSAAARGLVAIEWWVYARDCAVPNPKLERVLHRYGFEIRETPAGAECYWQRKSINDELRRRRP